MTVGLAIIAKDEEENLPRLLASVAGAFDQVALVDTGSTDDTVDAFWRWACESSFKLPCRVQHFDWEDDFAAARQAADELLDTDWRAFADADDELRGADRLRGLAEGTPDGVACLAFDYEGDRDRGPRVRLTRRGWTRWQGPVHEVPVLTRPAGIRVVPSEVAAWVHRRTDRKRSDERNRRILDGWLAAEPDNPRALALRRNELAREAA